MLTAQGHRNVKQHRFVMECHIGRLLSDDEDVHHIDGCKTNNVIGNLQLLTHSEHARLHNRVKAARAAITLATGAAS
ncbi:HNH endonuclease [Sphingomonas melonis]|uniref:HNH nuclease domain-containing protein n=1 Tax=Sphingomonas melonis TaxID=152682 RepID=A0A7Y9FK37_9SPHN|nr:hypothetical protein [Sphingomonas melonis]